MSESKVLYSIPFKLEIVHQKKNKLSIVISTILSYIKSVFIDCEVISAEILDHYGGKHGYELGKFLYPDKFDISTDKSTQNDEPLIWKGTVDLKTNQLRYLISNLNLFPSKNNQPYGYFWIFDRNSLNLHQDVASLSAKSKLSTKLDNFALGTIVNGDRFVSHLSTNLNPKFNNLNVNLDPNKNELILAFTLIDKTTLKKKVKLCYDCNSIKIVNIPNVKHLSLTLYVHLTYASKMFVSESLENGWPRIKWKRKSCCGPISRDLIGKCNVLSLTWLSYDTTFIPTLDAWRRHLNCDFSFGSIINRSHFGYESTDKYFPDKIKFALACIKSLNYNYQDDLQINHHGEQIINAFIKAQIDAGKCDQVERALHQLFDAYANGKVYNVFKHFEYLLNKVELEWNSIKDLGKDTENVKFIKTVMLTPTRTVFMPPVMTRTCGFLDIAETDCVLRVIYRDESYGTLSSTFNNCEEKDVDCVTSMLKERILENGLCVAGRTYQYFGASPSQLKDGGMILYAKDSQNRTAASIRDSLGIVKEKSVPKYMARIGLSLSQVMAFVDLPKCTQIFLANDIYGGYNLHTDRPYNFTDGCGSISVEVACYIYEDLLRQKVLERKGDDSYVPSAFQIRFMGSKGMLVVDPRLTGWTLVIRESMQKMFTKIDFRIGIVKVSESRRAYLNKPFIMVLNQIGLSNDYFINLTLSTLNVVNSSFYDEQVASMTMKLYSHLHRVVNIDAFAGCNFSFTNDSFFKSILHLAVNQAIDSLKNKQRIPLPWSGARTMFGVCDITAKSPKVLSDKYVKQGICQPPKFPVYMDGLGTGVLKAGQVFCWPSDFTEPYRGELIVTKFPTSHLGDVRRLVAVDCKELHAIRDCIVFPVDGKRPHQDKMAGSDLDGDEYCVIWMEDFLRIHERTPMIYNENLKIETQEEINDEVMIKHHINCVKADQVGQISNAQLALADSKGFNSLECLNLGWKYNGALDAPKNGFDSKYVLNHDDRALEAPDFMNKWSRTPTYYSTSASGEIYRLVNLHEHSSNLLNVPTKFEPSPDIDERLLHPKMLKFITFATESLLVYKSIMDNLLTRYGLKLEVELFTGILNGSSSLHNECSRFKDKEDAMIATINSLLINKMDELFDFKLFNVSEDDKMAAASAIYYVSKQKVKEAKTNYIGLPFIGKCSSYLRKCLQHKSHKVDNKKKQEKTSHTQAIAIHDQQIEVIINKIKNKVESLIAFFHLHVPQWKISESLSQIDIMRRQLDSFIISSLSKEDVIAELIKENKSKLTNFSGLRNSEIDIIQFIDSTIPTLIWSLLVDELTVHKLDKSEFINQSFLVWWCEQDSFRELLEKTLASDTKIEIRSDSKVNWDSIPVIIHGSPTSRWVASIIIGIHNRLISLQAS